MKTQITILRIFSPMLTWDYVHHGAATGGDCKTSKSGHFAVIGKDSQERRNIVAKRPKNGLPEWSKKWGWDTFFYDPGANLCTPKQDEHVECDIQRPKKISVLSCDLEKTEKRARGWYLVYHMKRTEKIPHTT